VEGVSREGLGRGMGVWARLTQISGRRRLNLAVRFRRQRRNLHRIQGIISGIYFEVRYESLQYQIQLVDRAECSTALDENHPCLGSHLLILISPMCSPTHPHSHTVHRYCPLDESRFSFISHRCGNGPDPIQLFSAQC